MSEAISDPRYWRRRLREAGQLHHAIFKCPLERWQRIEAKHREILKEKIGPNDSILDVGCGWGRLLTLLPETWRGYYLGLDLSPEFIELAKRHHPWRLFAVADIRQSYTYDVRTEFKLYDWAILISIRPMMKRHLGDEEWSKVEANVRKVAKQLLYLEYDENDEGSIE